MRKPTKAFKQMIKSGKTSKNGFDTRHIHTHTKLLCIQNITE